MHGRHLVGVRHEHGIDAAPEDDGCDEKARARRIVVQHAERGVGIEHEPDFLGQLTPRAVDGRLARLEPPAGQRPLPRVLAQIRRTPREQKARASGRIAEQHDGHGRRPPPIDRQRPPLEHREMRARPRAKRVIEERPACHQ